MTTIIYGLKNCDTCRKAKKWLTEQGIDHKLHDVRSDGLDGDTLTRWVGEIGWETLMNRRGTTWRGLPEELRADVDETTATALMLEHPALIKRPVFEHDGQLGLGFPALKQAVEG